MAVKGTNTHGFTLTELTIVIALVGTIGVAILFNNMPVRSYFDLRALSAQLIHDIRSTQILSLSLNGSYSIALNATNYQINNPDGSLFSNSLNPNPVTLPAGVTLSPVATITFDTNGRPASATTVTISVAGLSRTLTLRAQTGFIDG